MVLQLNKGILSVEVARMKKKQEKFPMDATPDVHMFPGVPQSCFDIVNQYGTYNIQPTVDTENTFPLVGQGLPTQWKNMAMGKKELEKEE